MCFSISPPTAMAAVHPCAERSLHLKKKNATGGEGESISV